MGQGDDADVKIAAEAATAAATAVTAITAVPSPRSQLAGRDAVKSAGAHQTLESKHAVAIDTAAIAAGSVTAGPALALPISGSRKLTW